MKWLLVMYVMTGEVHGLQTKEFVTYEECDKVAIYISKQNSHFFSQWRTNPFCMEIQ